MRLFPVADCSTFGGHCTALTDLVHLFDYFKGKRTWTGLLEVAPTSGQVVVACVDQALRIFFYFWPVVYI